jgi:hypothetical protein
MLKSSDIISDYLSSLLVNNTMEQIYTNMEHPFLLVLKKFYKISIGCEFRCIVKNKILIGTPGFSFLIFFFLIRRN